MKQILSSGINRRLDTYLGACGLRGNTCGFVANDEICVEVMYYGRVTSEIISNLLERLGTNRFSVESCGDVTLISFLGCGLPGEVIAEGWGLDSPLKC